AELLTLKEWERAIGVLQDFRRQFPQHQLQPEVARKLAVAYSEANRPGEAAAEFERIASNPAESRSVQREALMQSADLYSKAGNNPKAMGMLEKFVDTNPTPLADAEEAQLALAQPARDAFRAVRLTAPLKKSLIVKRDALEHAMDGYKRAAEYQVAEVTTAATYEMAELYGGLAKDILASERPAKLKGDALEEYNSLLEEQVFPFEEQAIKAHELNAARAKDG